MSHLMSQILHVERQNLLTSKECSIDLKSYIKTFHRYVDIVQWIYNSTGF